MNDYIYINNQKDAEYFIEQCNGLHDGLILSFSFQHNGISNGGYRIDYSKTKLTMQVLVTSHIDKIIVEMVFEGIFNWNICSGMTDIYGSNFAFDRHGIIWTDAFSTDPKIYKENTYIQAHYIGWKIIGNAK